MSGTGLPTSQRSDGWDDPWRRWDASGGHETQRPLSKAAVTSLVLGIVNGAFLGLVFGIVGLVATRERGTRRGRGLAWAGIALSLLWVVAIVGFVGWRLSGEADRGRDGTVQQAGRSDIHDLQRGDCLQSPADTSGSLTDVRVLPCTQTHDAQVFAVVQASGGDYDTARIQAEVEQACTAAGQSEIASPDRYDLLYIVPQRDGWENGDRSGVCVLSSSTPLTGSVLTG